MWPPEGQWQVAVRIGAVVLPLVTCAVFATVRDSITAATVVLVLVLWVVAAAATGDRTAGLLAAVSGGAWFDFFLTAPYRQFAIKGSDDIEATILLVVIGLAVTEIALWGYRQQARAAGRSGYLEGVLGAARLVVGRGHARLHPGGRRRPPDHRRPGCGRVSFRPRPRVGRARGRARPRRGGHPG